MMNCQNCNAAVIYPLSIAHLSFIKLFISDPDVLANYKSILDFYENENSKRLVGYIFKASLTNPGLLKQMYELQSGDLTFSTLCPECKYETKEQFWNWHNNDIFYELQKIQKDFVFGRLSLLTGLSKASLATIYETGNGDTSYLYLIELTLKKIDPDLADMVRTSDEAIEFFHYNEKGGDGDGELLMFILGYVSSSIIPSLIYDSVKFGGKNLFLWVQARITAKTTKKAIEERVQNQYPEFIDLYATESILRHLPKRLRKKVIKKVIKSTVDAKTKEILISIHDKLRNIDAER